MSEQCSAGEDAMVVDTSLRPLHSSAIVLVQVGNTLKRIDVEIIRWTRRLQQLPIWRKKNIEIVVSNMCGGYYS